MKYKKYLTNLKHRFFKKKTLVQDPQLMHPEREWGIGLFIAVLIFSFCGYWSIFTYLKNRAATAQPIDDNGGQVVYRESVVKEALEIVGRREQDLKQLISEPVVTEPLIEETASTTVPVTEELEIPAAVPIDSGPPTLGN